MVAAWRQLQLVADEFRRKHSLAISLDGRLYLEWLLLRGARVISQEGAADDPDAMGLARKNIELLLATAGGAALATGGPEPALAGVPVRSLRKRITSLDIRRALHSLPPLYPLTTRRRNARPAGAS